MQELNVITDDADQNLIFPLPDGTSVQLEFIYRPGIQRWAMNVVHPLLTIKGLMLSVQPNILRPWKNLIPFGIAILTATGLDPILATDFLDGSCTVNILSASEVQQVETDVLAPIPLVNP